MYYLQPAIGVVMGAVKRIERLTQRSDVLYEVATPSFVLKIKHEPSVNKRAQE